MTDRRLCAACRRPFNLTCRPCGVRRDLCSQACQRAFDYERLWSVPVCFRPTRFVAGVTPRDADSVRARAARVSELARRADRGQPLFG